MLLLLRVIPPLTTVVPVPLIVPPVQVKVPLVVKVALPSRKPPLRVAKALVAPGGVGLSNLAVPLVIRVVVTL